MKQYFLTLIILVMTLSGLCAKPVEVIDNGPSQEYSLTNTNMSKVTKKDIQAWKEKYANIYEIESDGKIGYIFDPTSDLRIMKMVVSSAKKGGNIEMTEAVINNCWLGGDEVLRTDEQYLLGITNQMDDLIDLPDYEVKYHANHAIVTIDQKSCKLKLPTRGDIKYAENRNKKDKPFDTSIHLISRIAVDGVEEIQKNTRSYLGLLLAVSELSDQKYVGVKKL